jgi:RNA polymerase sigma-70 factor (ECF subfamily)
MDALLGMLAPDVVVHGDGGGKAQAIGKPLAGRQRVMRLLVGLFRRGRILGASLRLAWVNGQPGAVMYDAEGRVFSVIELDVADGMVQAIRGVVNPDKLGHIGSVSDVARLPEKELARGTPAPPQGSGKRSGGGTASRQTPQHREGGNR